MKIRLKPALIAALSLCMLMPSYVYGEDEPAGDNTTQQEQNQDQNQDPPKSDDTSASSQDDPAPNPPVSKGEKSSFHVEDYAAVDADGKVLDSISKGQEFTLVMTAIDNTISTEQALAKGEVDKINQTIHSLNINRATDSFSGGNDIQVILLSQGSQPLKVKIIFKGVKYRGKGDQFKFRIGYSALDIGYTEQTVQIEECNENSKPSDDSNTPAPDVPAGGGDYSGGGFVSGGSSYFGGSSDSGSSSPTPVKTAAPNLIVKSYSAGSDKVMAGQTFDLDIDFYNTSKNISAENIVVSLETEEGIAIAEGTNTFFYDSLGAGASKKVKVKMKALSTDKNASPNINVNFKYDYVADDERMNQTSAQKIAIPVYLQDRFEISQPVLPEKSASGSECAVTFSYVNKGKGTISNVAVKVEGDIPALMPVQNLGNFEPGKNGTIDVIFVPQKEGKQKGTVVITYEDASDTVVTKKYPIELDVTAPEVPETIDPSQADLVETDQSSPWIWIVGIAAAAALAFFAIRRRRKRKMEKADSEEFDEDFDDFENGQSAQPETGDEINKADEGEKPDES